MKKIMYLLFVLLFVLPIYNFSYCQSAKENIILTGNLYNDSKIAITKFEENNTIVESESVERKSPVKAGLFSLAIPGAGQFYNGDILLSAVFLVAEAAFITTAVVYNNKGNDQTDYFQNYADQHWSVKAYAQWTLNNLSNLNSSLKSEDYNVFDNNGNVVWSELNRMERDIGDGYSHTLPAHGEQQYYEEIGKYNQFSSGWDDFTGDDYHTISPNYIYYSGQRGEANDLYRVSTRAVTFLYINHVLSALEAAWGASRFNSNLSVNMRLRAINLTGRIEYVPTMNVNYSF